MSSIRGLDDDKLDEIVSRVVERLTPRLGRSGAVGPATRPKATPSAESACGPPPPLVRRAPRGSAGRSGVYDDLDGAVADARRAHEELVHKLTLEDRERIIEALRQCARDLAPELAMRPGVRIVLVTGGPGVVKAAMASGKRAICGSPGNSPVVVDETADIRRTGQGTVKGCNFGNTIICTDEKEVFVVTEVADLLKREMCVAGAVELTRVENSRLERLVIDTGVTRKRSGWARTQRRSPTRSASGYPPTRASCSVRWTARTTRSSRWSCSCR